ncbi:hypothetical protein GQ600_22458 [Phytophthora cactorum]|nr:hypothetical protein GQ600_22458 [Phytophthora cactorum]
MRDKFLKKSTTVRAASKYQMNCIMVYDLPDTILDSTSEAYKIFSAGKPYLNQLASCLLLTSHQDWSDNNDPYALGYLALKSRIIVALTSGFDECLTGLRLNSERNKKRRSKSIWSSRPKLRSSTLAARRSCNNGTSAVQQSLPSGRTPVSALPANDYALFVRDIAKQCRWTEKVVYNVLRCMQHSIDLYRSNKLVDFFYKIASLTPGVMFQDLFANAHYILTHFKQRFGTLDGFENLELTAPGINSPVSTSDQETKELDHVASHEVNHVLTAANTQSSAAEENANMARSSEELIADGDKCGHDQTLVGSPVQHSPQANNGEDERDDEQSPLLESPAQTPQTGNEDAVLDGDEHEHEQSPLLASPVQTPQTGTEDGADEHSSSTADKQFSPGLLNCTVAIVLLPSTHATSSWWIQKIHGTVMLIWMMTASTTSRSDRRITPVRSGSSNFSDTKDSHHHSKSNAPLGNNLLAGQPASKKPSKRGKDEQYGKNFKLAKKRRLDEKTSASTKDDYEDEDRDDEGYDEGDDDDESEDAGDEPSADVDSLSSDGELEETPHPLQSILDSLDAHMVDLQEKQRVLIEQKETCQWRQHQYVDRQYGVQTNAQSFSSQW